MKRYIINHITELRNVGGFSVTTSTYDMGDRRTEVNLPASGITSFTYDALGNVLTKQTANLAKEGKFTTYDYDYQRLTGINYPDHTENNVKYYYGGRNAQYKKCLNKQVQQEWSRFGYSQQIFENEIYNRNFHVFIFDLFM